MRKINRWQRITLFFIALFFTACTFYVPDYEQVTSSKSYFTVDAELTNQAGGYRVNLTNSSTNISVTQNILTISGAKVYLTDEKNNKFIYAEGKLGTYISPANFVGNIGSIYTAYRNPQRQNL
jgi:hypothetical protein